MRPSVTGMDDVPHNFFPCNLATLFEIVLSAIIATTSRNLTGYNVSANITHLLYDKICYYLFIIIECNWCSIQYSDVLLISGSNGVYTIIESADNDMFSNPM